MKVWWVADADVDYFKVREFFFSTAANDDSGALLA